MPPKLRRFFLSSLQRLEGVSQTIEIIVARGRMPSVQRNFAVARATGDWIWFRTTLGFSRIGKRWRSIQREDVDVIGGPESCPSDAPWLAGFQFSDVLETGFWTKSSPLPSGGC